MKSEARAARAAAFTAGPDAPLSFPERDVVADSIVEYWGLLGDVAYSSRAVLLWLIRSYGTPPIEISPEVGRRIPVRSVTRVDLPAPGCAYECDLAPGWDDQGQAVENGLRVVVPESYVIQPDGLGRSPASLACGVQTSPRVRTAPGLSSLNRRTLPEYSIHL